LPKPIVRVYRGILDIQRTRGDRRSHEIVMLDPRTATEHRIAHQRSLDEGGDGCPFCR
jgi:hypothetical protein